MPWPRNMRFPAILAVVLAVALSSCSATAPPSQTPEPDSGTGIVSTSPSTAPAHTPFWLTIKYRSDPVDVADPRFEYLDGGSSSFVDGAFYDANNGYLIISLNGTAYHYCGLPPGVWSTFTTASSLGSFYNTQIKGRFDCRTGTAPEYQR